MNNFAGEESNCLNQLMPVIGVNWTNPSGSLLGLFFNAMPDPQAGNVVYNKHSARTGRLSLENVAAALSPGEFYVAADCSAAYPHCGGRRGRTLFYMPKDAASPADAPVLPRLYSLVEVRGAGQTKHFFVWCTEKP